MKKEILLTLVMMLFSTSIAFSQEWFHIGDKWFFDDEEMLMFPAHGFRSYEVVGDTVIVGKQAKIIEKNTVDFGGALTNTDSVFVYEKNSKVYFWKDSEFTLMCDFSKNTGDTLGIAVEMLDCDSISPIIVDSVTNVTINGLVLKKQYYSFIQYSSVNGYQTDTVCNEVLEYVGSEADFTYLPLASPHPICVFTYQGLRCFEGNNFQYVSPYWSYSCDTLINGLTAIDELNSATDIEIYPNPSNGVVYISYPKGNTTIDKIELYSLSGKKISEFKTPNYIDLTDFPKGVYFIKICGNIEGHNVIRKIVRE